MSKLLRSCSTFLLCFAIVFMALLSQPLSPKVAAAPSADFDESGVVDFTDFLLFVSAFGIREDQEEYDANYDLNGDGEIGFADFLIFASSLAKRLIMRWTRDRLSYAQCLRTPQMGRISVILFPLLISMAIALHIV